MDTTFLSYSLTFFLAIILVSYLYQITEGNNIKNKHKKLKHGKYGKHGEYDENDEHNNLLLMLYNENNKTQNYKSIYNNKHSVHKTQCMPIHHVGPVYNFHQHFNKYKTMPGVGYPTGIPEMGWRNLFLSNYSKNQVVDEDPFAEIPTRNFLDNLDNVKNIYREQSEC